MSLADAPWVGHCGDEYYGEGEREEYVHCDVCGETIYYGDEFYEVGNAKVCQDCIDAGKRTAR